eukprot:scaffold834_cov123-Cylindrotheca_fusiformis.AAC.22
MASQEHLQQILENADDDDSSNSSSTTSNSGTSDNDDTPEAASRPVAGPVPATSAISPFRLPSSIHPKKRLKLSMKVPVHAPSSGPADDKEDASAASPKPEHEPSSKTPNSSSTSTQPQPPRPRLNKRSLPLKKKKMNSSSQEEGGEISVMVVDSDGEDDAVATAVIEEPTPVAVKSSSGGGGSSSVAPTTKKKPTPLTPKNVKLPPFSSPGLLLPANNSVTTIRGKPATEDTNKSGLTTMASVFDLYMNMIGYTDETRTKRPHIGSSVKRQVGDMFDSNVQFALHFPRLVPEDLVPDTSSDEMKEDSLAESLISAFDKKRNRPKQQSPEEEGGNTTNGTHKTTMKRRKLIQFSDMVPLSLTLPYPEWYIEKQVEYVQKVKAREQAILEYKKEVEALEMENVEDDGASESIPKKPKTVVPPIPRPPSPPQLEHLPALDKDQFDDSQHPLYPPKSKQLVAHLDKDCFHITEGRYFALTCNSIADPHFVGPCAPGISGLNSTTGNGLATAHSGAPSSTGGVSIQPTALHNPAGNKTSNAKKVPNTMSSSSDTKKKKQNNTGLRPTSSLSALHKTTERGGEEADKMRTCIIRAAVHASRTRRHSQSFRAPDGEIYPDIDDAFTEYSGLKPCIRCKSNNHGAYHCRLRRRHKDLDYNGGDSSGVLVPLFRLPLQDLLFSKPTQTTPG